MSLFSEKCKSMLNDLSSHKRDKEYLMLEYINLRLDKSFTNYFKDLSSSLEYLERKNSINVMKKMNRLYK